MSATQALVAAIVARYNSSAGDAIRTAGSTGIYFGRAPQSASYPFIVLSIPASEAQPTAGQGTDAAGQYADIEVQVSCFTDQRSPSVPFSVIGAWHAAFNFQTLSLASPYRQVWGRKIDDGIPIEEPSEKGWQVAAVYGYNIAE